MREDKITQETRYNSGNERLKWKYLAWEKGANGKSEKTLDMIRRAIKVYENFHGLKDLEKIASSKHITSFKSHHQKQCKSKSTLLNRLKSVKAFYLWLSKQNGYKSKINISDLEYFNLSNHEMMQAKKTNYKPFPTMEQLKKVVENMPSNSELENRNRALICFCVLSGMRVEAITSLRLKHIDIDKGLITQNGSEVKTKFAKTIHTFFFPVDNLFKTIFIDWYNYLLKEKLLNLDDPLFPKALTEQDENNSFKYEHVSKKFWTSTGQIRVIFKEAFERTGLTYHNPHSIRNTLVNLGERVCKNPEEFKAWSQNLGHENVSTTFTSYGNISVYRQEELFNQFKGEKNE